MLENKVALITGSSRGIGHDVARLYLENKANVVICGSKLENAEKTVMECLALVELADDCNKYPDELSGGMKSRVSLARALAFGGDLFLFDEPFAALDEELRRKLSQKIKFHLQKRGASAILVTHNREDAQLIADRIITFRQRIPNNSLTVTNS